MTDKSDSRQEMLDQLDRVAAGWIAREDRGPLEAREARSLEQWLASSKEHRAAYVRSQAALAYLDMNMAQEKADGLPLFMKPDLDNSSRGVSRRNFLWYGGGIGAAAAAAASAAFFLLKAETPTVTYAARRGEILPVSLPDGTIVTLDTNSVIAVKFLPQARKVELRSGRALFDVAKDKARPFIVTSGGLNVTAVGTKFVVRNTNKRPTDVLVQEGIVDVGPHIETIRSARSAEAIPVRVGANMRVVASATGSALNVISVDPVALSHESAWQQGVFEVELETLASVAEEYARYSDTHIVIPDPKIAALTINGRFLASDPLGFAKAAASSFNLKLEINGPEIRLLSL